MAFSIEFCFRFSLEIHSNVDEIPSKFVEPNQNAVFLVLSVHHTEERKIEKVYFFRLRKPNSFRENLIWLVIDFVLQSIAHISVFVYASFIHKSFMFACYCVCKCINSCSLSEFIHFRFLWVSFISFCHHILWSFLHAKRQFVLQHVKNENCHNFVSHFAKNLF